MRNRMLKRRWEVEGEKESRREEQENRDWERVGERSWYECCSSRSNTTISFYQLSYSIQSYLIVTN